MMRHNLFEGESYYAFFAQLTYKWMMSGKWITYADIMADYMGCKSAKELPYNLSNCDNYGELKKAFRDVRKAINEKLNDECFEEEGNNRAKSFRYIGKDVDPLADMRNAKVVKDLKHYWQFCQNSAGFFPTAWLEYFFKDCRDLLDIKKKRQTGEQVLSSSLDRILKNIELLPFLYEAIMRKQVLLIEYKPYSEDVQHLVFHPHYLKEFDGRWHLFGHAEGLTPVVGYDLALDRIVNRPLEQYDKEYVSAPKGYYEDFFKNRVGVSRMQGMNVETVRFRTHGMNMYKLAETKPIHKSQTEVTPYGEYEDGSYAEFELQLEINNEFIGRILKMGAGLEVVAPQEIRAVFAQRISEMHSLYRL